MKVRCKHHPDSPEVETADLLPSLEPINCSECGCRLGWVDESHGENSPFLYCDCCAADYSRWAREEAD